MANRDYDDDRYDGGRRDYGPDDQRHAQGSRWTRGADDRPGHDRGGNDSWGERIGHRINRFFTDLERDYRGGGQRGRRDQAYQDDDRSDRFRDERGYGQGGGFDRDRGAYGGQYSQFSRSGGQQGPERGPERGERDWGPSSSGGYGRGGYASGGSYGRGGWGQDQGGFGTSGYGQGHGSGQDYGVGQGAFRGKGPKGYTRSDSRIEEDVSERLSRGGIDASEIEVKVENGEVTLSGTAPSRQDRRRAEDLAEDVSGVRHVQNNIRVQDAGTWAQGGSQGSHQSEYRSGDARGYAQGYASGGMSGSQSGSQTGGGAQSASQSGGTAATTQSYASSDAGKL